MRIVCWLVFFPIGLGLLSTGCRRDPEPHNTDMGYQKSIEDWRAERLEGLKKPMSWLRLAGLFWLKKGENRIGSNPAGEIVLPERAPAQIGTISVGEEINRLAVEPGVEASKDGQAVTDLVLIDDGEGERKADEIRVGDFVFKLIVRNGRLAVRLWDDKAESLTEFQGLSYYPIDKRLRVFGEFVAYDKPRKLMLTTVIDTKVEATIPGDVVFQIDGTQYKLLPIAEAGAEAFFFVFGDETNGNGTYGGGRFLYAKWPKDSGKVEIDFNKAYNPPCAFSRFATCPVPRKENRLPIPIEAGEKAYPKH